MRNHDEVETGLSSGNKTLIVALCVLVLFLSGLGISYGMVAQSACWILLPILLWLSLGCLGNKWSMTKLANDRLNRGIIGMLAGIFFFGAYLASTATYHSECTQTVQTRDGSECVGDYVTVKGSDKGGAFIWVLLGMVAFWYATAERKEDGDSR